MLQLLKGYRALTWMIAYKYGSAYELAFANGGDQNYNAIPEKRICEKFDITLIDGPGDKIQSSSWLLRNE